MAVDFHLTRPLSLFVFALYAYFSLFHPDVVHIPHNFLLPGVPVRFGVGGVSVALSHRCPGLVLKRFVQYSGLRGRRLSLRKRQRGYSTTPLPSVHRRVFHRPHVSRIPRLSFSIISLSRSFSR